MPTTEELIVWAIDNYKNNKDKYEILHNILCIYVAFSKIDCTPLKTETEILDGYEEFYKNSLKELRERFTLLIKNETFKSSLGYWRFNRLKKIYKIVMEEDLTPNQASDLRDAFDKILKGWAKTLIIY